MIIFLSIVFMSLVPVPLTVNNLLQRITFTRLKNDPNHFFSSFSKRIPSFTRMNFVDYKFEVCYYLTISLKKAAKRMEEVKIRDHVRNVVKDRFLAEYNRKREETGLSLIGILEEIKRKTGTVIPEQTAKDSVNWAKAPNENFMIAFCYTFDININELYFEPKSTDDGFNSRSATVFDYSVDCHQLTDPHFFGEYYGYYFNSQHEGVLDSFILNINEYEAILTLKVHVSNGAQGLSTDTRKFIGKPMHLERDLVFIVFQQPTGDEFYTFAFNWFKINTDRKMYFRQGALLTQCRSEIRYPQIQSFIFLDREIPENQKDARDLLAGQLRLCNDSSSDYIFLKKDVLKSFFNEPEPVKKHHNVTSGLECLKYYEANHECVWFDEKSIRIDLKNSGFDSTYIERVICMLKSRSMNPRTVVFFNNKKTADFIRLLGIKPEEE